MLSLIEVKCPHCSARGQLMLPPMGAIIIGPCPECHELVVVFCGRVLPLDKEVMVQGSFEEKRDHLMNVLTSFLEERVSQLLKEALPPEENEAQESLVDDEVPDAKPQPGGAPPFPRKIEPPFISETEMTDFVRVDLNLIDKRDYFKAVFG